MLSADELTSRSEKIICRYENALRDADSPLTATPERWQDCREQAESILGECIQALRGSPADTADMHSRTRDLGIRRARDQVLITHSIRAGMLLWRVATNELRQAAQDADLMEARQLTIAMDALHQAITIRLYVGAAAHDHTRLLAETALSPDASAESSSSLVFTTSSQATGSLTPREWEVIKALAQFHNNKAIAQHLNIADTTVKSHLQNIFRKLEATSRLDALAKAGLHAPSSKLGPGQVVS